MAKPLPHTRIIQHPFTASMQGARLDAFREEQHEQRRDIVMDIQAFERAGSELFEREGKIHERVWGNFVPARLRFSGVEILRKNPFYTSLDSLPPEDPQRTIRDLLSWYMKENGEKFYMLSMNSPQVGSLQILVQRVSYRKLAGAPTPITIERDWSPAPPMPAGIVPVPKHLHGQFGGDPVSVAINSRPYPRRLFVGGLESQGKQRPSVDAVLNIGEAASEWAKSGEPNPADRWENKGEGSQGMSLEEIRQEAQWVIERLHAGQKVLVHCVAGMNRSATICCAAVMLLEGLSAEQALERVRAHHPWSRPDANHWLKLRWMAQISK
jgi:hypothetical protein